MSALLSFVDQQLSRQRNARNNSAVIVSVVAEAIVTVRLKV